VNTNKTHFVIFDFCQNFEFFGENPDGMEGRVTKSLTQQIFEAKLELAVTIREEYSSSDEQRAFADATIDELNQAVAGLDRDRFVVKARLRTMVEFSNKARWANLTKGDQLDINTHLSALVLPDEADDEFARRFDILILRFQLALLTGAQSTEGFVLKINGLANDLLKKLNIPEVKAQEKLLREAQSESFWQAMKVNHLEEVRGALRDLMKYIDKESQVNVVTTFEDTLDHEGIKEQDLIPEYQKLQSYKDRVESYVRQHSDHLVIQKLKTNKPITETELQALENILFDGETVGSKQDYIETYGEKPLGEFVRSIIGLEANAAQAVFADFIQLGDLRADQMTFINTIIRFLTTNGRIDKAMLFEPPFTNIHDQGLLGVFKEANATKVINLIERINRNALPVDERLVG